MITKGVHFLFEDFEQLIRLHIGMSDRLDENRSESFTLMHCDFSEIDIKIIDQSLEQVLRGSDCIVNFGKDYFFVLPYTDKFGAAAVNKMFEEFFTKEIRHFAVSYPVDGESPKALLTELQDNVSRKYKNDLKFLDFIVYREY
jgi:hypothetical protein